MSMLTSLHNDTRDPTRLGSDSYYNYYYVRAPLPATRKDIREGDTVVVEKAGDVIPRVVGPILNLRPDDSVPWVMPTTCKV